jgi:hypothetical protein
VLEQIQKIVMDSWPQLMAKLAQAIADGRSLPAITDTLDSVTCAGSGDRIVISHPTKWTATQAVTGRHILSN